MALSQLERVIPQPADSDAHRGRRQASQGLSPEAGGSLDERRRIRAAGASSAAACVLRSQTMALGPSAVRAASAGSGRCRHRHRSRTRPVPGAPRGGARGPSQRRRRAPEGRCGRWWPLTSLSRADRLEPPVVLDQGARLHLPERSHRGGELESQVIGAHRVRRARATIARTAPVDHDRLEGRRRIGHADRDPAPVLRAIRCRRGGGQRDAFDVELAGPVSTSPC